MMVNLLMLLAGCGPDYDRVQAFEAVAHASAEMSVRDFRFRGDFLRLVCAANHTIVPKCSGCPDLGTYSWFRLLGVDLTFADRCGAQTNPR